MRRIALFTTLMAFPGVAFAGGDGIPWTEIGLHAVNFVLLVGGLAILTRPIIKDALNQRTASIRDELEESNRLRREALNRFEDLESKIAHFEDELERMKAEGAEAAEREATHIAERTERDIELLKESTQRTIRSETEQARRALRREAVDLAVRLAEEQLRAQVGADDQARLNTELLGSIGQEAANG